jgi:hypothetical protein
MAEMIECPKCREANHNSRISCWVCSQSLVAADGSKKLGAQNTHAPHKLPERESGSFIAIFLKTVGWVFLAAVLIIGALILLALVTCGGMLVFAAATSH